MCVRVYVSVSVRMHVLCCAVVTNGSVCVCVCLFVRYSCSWTP